MAASNAMRRLTDLNTGAKLALAFGFMAALIALVGYVGIRGMATMRENGVALHEREALGVFHIEEASIDLIATQGAVRAALLDEAADKWTAEVRKRDASFREQFAKYRATVSNPEDLAKAKHLETLFNELREVQDMVLQLVKTGKSAQARSMWPNLDPLLEVVAGALDELSESKVAAMETTAKKTWASYTEITAIVGSVILAAITSAVLLGILITGLIARPLRGAVRVLESVAEGDLTQRMEETGSNDEVGRMGLALNRALQSMNDALLDVSTAADRTAGASLQMSQAAMQLSAGAQEQATGHEEAAASLEEITTTLKNSAEHTRKASEFAADSRKVAEKGGSVVASTVQAMEEIECVVAPDCRHHGRDRLDRVPDQHPRAQCGGGSRARRRGGQGLRGRRGRGAQPRAALCGGGKADQAAHPGFGGESEDGLRARGPIGRDAERDHRIDPAPYRADRRHRFREPGAVRRR